MKDLESLYKSHFDFIFRICFRYTKDSDEAKDLTHEVFLKVNRSLSTFQEKSKISTWIYKVAICVCIDWVRREKSRGILIERLLDPVVIENLTGQVEDQALARIELNRILKPVRPSVRRILFLHYAEGLTYDEIAEVVGVSKSAVAKTVYRFLQKTPREKHAFHSELLNLFLFVLDVHIQILNTSNHLIARFGTVRALRT